MDIIIGQTTQTLTDEESAAVEAKGGEEHLIGYLNQYIAYLVDEAQKAEKCAHLAKLAEYDEATLASLVDQVETARAAQTEPKDVP